MKCFFCNLFIVLMLTVSACSLKGNSDNEAGDLGDASAIDAAELNTTIRFVATEHDFGQVREGNKVVCTFEVVNTGKVDLFIHNVRVSCGCTSPKYDKNPIRPGRKGSIEVTFDTKGRQGNQRNSVTVFTNSEPSSTVLSFTCEVIPNIVIL